MCFDRNETGIGSVMFANCAFEEGHDIQFANTSYVIDDTRSLQNFMKAANVVPHRAVTVSIPAIKEGTGSALSTTNVTNGTVSFGGKPVLYNEASDIKIVLPWSGTGPVRIEGRCQGRTQDWKSICANRHCWGLEFEGPWFNKTFTSSFTVLRSL